ncbi:LLM class flavin-dependent oxidoreductase [Rhodococcus aetherivorans]
MIEIQMMLEMRLPRDGEVSHDQYYECGLRLAEIADEIPLTAILLNEHHGSPDGYLSSPFVFGAAIAARTTKIRIMVPIMPSLHAPVEMAEHAVTLDLISKGRIDLLTLVGYRPEEFEMNDVSLADRASRTDEGLQVLRGAFSGNPFQWRGKEILVSPRPAQPQGPPIWVGGAVPASARRAARFGDGFYPTVPNEELFQIYREECQRIGKGSGAVWHNPLAPLAIFVSDDVERTWEDIGEPCIHALNTYAEWAAAGSGESPMTMSMDVNQLRGSGIVQVLTPDETLRLAEEKERAGNYLSLHPLFGGIHPDVALRSMELFADKVVPRLDVRPPKAVERNDPASRSQIPA